MDHPVLMGIGQGAGHGLDNRDDLRDAQLTLPLQPLPERLPSTYGMA